MTIKIKAIERDKTRCDICAFFTETKYKKLGYIWRHEGSDNDAMGPVYSDHWNLIWYNEIENAGLAVNLSGKKDILLKAINEFIDKKKLKDLPLAWEHL